MTHFGRPTSRTANATAELLQSFEDNIKKTTDDLEERLETLNGNFESVLQRTIPESEPDATELRAIEEQRLSTHKCLQICAQLSVYLEQIQIRSDKDNRSSPAGLQISEGPEKIMNEGLQEWQESLTHTTQKLNKHMHYLINRLVTISKTGTSAEDAAELKRLQEEIETNRQFLGICSQAERQAKEKISQIDNYASGDDNLQLLVSTDGKIITGKNRLFGSRTQQLGGHIDSVTLQKITQHNSRIGDQTEEDSTASPQDRSPSVADDAPKAPSNPDFQGRYGTGRKLVLIPSTGTTSQERSEGVDASSVRKC